MGAPGVEGLLGDDVLDAAGVGLRHVRGHADALEEVGEYPVAFIDAFGHLLTGGQQGDGAVFIHLDIAAGLQKAHGAADAGLGIAHVLAHHVLAHVDGADEVGFFGEDEDGLQIHFAGFLQMHGISSFAIIVHL